jgi:hypothetical protein
LFGFFVLLAAVMAWGRTGSVSWADLGAPFTSRIIATTPWMFLGNYVSHTRRISVTGVILALIGAVALRTAGLSPDETLDHWIVGVGIYVALVLIIPVVARRLGSRPS